MLERGGFDAFVGNPPFIKGHFISQHFGDDYRAYLADKIHGEKTGLADICALFMVRAYGLLDKGGTVGLIATNTIAEGDTRKVGLERVCALGATILYAAPDIPWPGDASVFVSLVIIAAGPWKGLVVLSGYEITSISPNLEAGKGRQIFALNEGVVFVGSYLLGDGFVLQSQEASHVLSTTEHSNEVILPYINGVEFNSSPTQEPQRYAICFWDWPLEEVRQWKILAERVERLVKPIRDGVQREHRRINWWLHAENQPGLYHAVGLGRHFKKHPKNWNDKTPSPKRVIVKAKTSDTWAFGFLDAHMIFDQALTIIVHDGMGMFSALQSTVHETWARESGVGSKMKLDLRYSPSMFETFPFPMDLSVLEEVGRDYHEHRRQLMLARQEGLTKTYNRFHNPAEKLEDITHLRALHVEMDQAVAAAYGWTDLDLGHGFHETKQGIRFTLSEPARRAVLDRLLELNHQRYAEEVAQGLHDKKNKKGTGKSRRRKNSGSEETLPLSL